MPPRFPPRRRGALIAAFSAMAALVACSSGAAGPSPTSPTTSASTSVPGPRTTVDDHALLLGVVLPRGGAAPDMGVSMRAAIDLALKEINDSGGVLGKPVVLVAADEGDNPSSALLAVQGLLQRGVDAIIGPTSSLNVLNTLSTSVQAGVLTCSPTASALSLDAFPDNGLFVRTVPSDSLQAAAIATAVEDSGNNSAAVVYLDDAYGRPFAKATERALRQRNTTVSPSVPFSATEQSIADAVSAVTKTGPAVVVVVAGSSSGPAIIRAIDSASKGSKPIYVVNDAVRRPDAAAAPFDKDLGSRIRGVSPLAYSRSNLFTEALRAVNPDATGLYAVNAYDCVNLIALAAQSSGSTLGATMAAAIPSVSNGGSGCAGFTQCNDVLRNGRNPDYNGPDGSLSIDTNGNPTTAIFERFSFDESGRDVGQGTLTVGAG